ncbi:MAG: cation:proton antiporter [Planctomycetes bacterium]|nr:cation:proton antiporter [Planctomycetota bacterium]
MNFLLTDADMARFHTLQEIGVVLGVGVVASLVMARLKLPAVTGLLLAGAICGPYGAGFISDVKSLELLAEVGVVLLLFTIGLEFPLSRFKKIGKPLFIGGTLQVGLTVLASMGICMALGIGFKAAVPISFAISLSSTAIVLRALQDRGEVDAPHGRFIVGTLIYQDLCVIPMLLALPVLAGAGDTGGLMLNIGAALAQAAVAVVVTYLIAKLVLPFILRRVDKTRSREIFILSILSICIGIAFATGYAGLSLALGAFLAGIVLAESAFATRALTDVMPLRDVLNALFFISLGMLFNWRAVEEAPHIVAGVFLLIVLGKGLVASLAALAMRFPARAAWIAGLGLAQFGEFGTVILKTASLKGLLELDGEVRWITAAGVLSMFVTPLILRFSPHLAAGAVLLRPLEKLLGISPGSTPVAATRGVTGHVIIAGFGVTGRSLAAALKSLGVRYIILEMNAESVQQARKDGEEAFYGDATAEETLNHVRAEHAAAIVVTINDPGALDRCLDSVHRAAPEVPVIVRTRFLSERDRLQRLGATEVVTVEVEAAVEIMARVLRQLGIPRNVIDREVALVRENTQGTARSLTLPRNSLADMQELADLKVESALVNGREFAQGKTLSQLDLRARTGASVIALRRGGELASQPKADEALQVGDILYLVGSLESIRNALVFLESGEVPQRLSERAVAPASDARDSS